MSQQPEPKQPPKSALAPFFEEISRHLAPEYQGLAELLVNFREKPQLNDIARALFRARKLTAVLEEAQRQLIARGAIKAEAQ